jgi:cell division protein FtsB
MTIEKILDDCANTIRQQEAALLAEQKHNEMLMAEIEELKQKLKLAEWDEDAWKKFKQDNYEVINLGDIKEDRDSAIYATGYWNGVAKGKEND